jgi:type I restriction enzyme S subunit
MNKVRIADFIDEIGDGIHGTPIYSPDGEYYFINGNNLKDGIIAINDDTLKLSESEFQRIKRPLSSNSILISINGTIGNVSLYNGEKVALGKSACYINVKPSEDRYYIKTILTTKTFLQYAMRVAHGSTIKNLAPSQIADYSFDAPDKNERDKISYAIRCIDNKIALNKRINAELEAMAKTLYDYWFVQFDFPDENGKPYRTSGGKMEWNEQLKREIPKGWKVKQMSDLTAVVTGKEDANFSTPNGEYKFFTCSQDTLLCDTAAFEGHAVLIAGNGDFNVKHYSGKFNAYQRTYVLIPTDDKYYGCMYIALNDKVLAFKTGSNGSIVKFITKGDVEGATIFDVPQSALYRSINSIIYQIEHLNREGEELTRLRDWLLPMLMNGQATVE